MCAKCKGVKEANMPLYCQCAGSFDLTFSAKVSPLNQFHPSVQWRLHVSVLVWHSFCFVLFPVYRASLSRLQCSGTLRPTTPWTSWRRPLAGCSSWALTSTRVFINYELWHVWIGKHRLATPSVEIHLWTFSSAALCSRAVSQCNQETD